MRELGDSNLSLGLVYAPRGEPNPIESAGEVKAAIRATSHRADLRSASEFAVVGRLKAEGRCQTLAVRVKLHGGAIGCEVRLEDAERVPVHGDAPRSDGSMPPESRNGFVEACPSRVR